MCVECVDDVEQMACFGKGNAWMEERFRMFVLIVWVLLCSMIFAKVYQVYSVDDIEKAIATDILNYEQATVLRAKGINNASMLKVIGTIIESLPEKLFIERWEAKSLEQLGNVETTITYIYTETSAERKAVDDFISKNLPKIVGNAKSDLEKVFAINEWIKTYITYDESYSHKSVYATLKDRTGVCQGYALLFYKLAKAAGLDVYLVSGQAKPAEASADKLQSHAWNIVKIEDSWYYIDTTWNDSTRTNAYFLFGKNQARYSHYPTTKVSVTVSTKSYAEKLYEEIVAGNIRSRNLFDLLYGTLIEKYDKFVIYLTDALKNITSKPEVRFVSSISFVTKYLSSAMQEAMFKLNLTSVSYDYSYIYIFTFNGKDFFVWTVSFSQN